MICLHLTEEITYQNPHLDTPQLRRNSGQTHHCLSRHNVPSHSINMLLFIYIQIHPRTCVITPDIYETTRSVSSLLFHKTINLSDLSSISTDWKVVSLLLCLVIKCPVTQASPYHQDTGTAATYDMCHPSFTKIRIRQKSTDKPSLGVSDCYSQPFIAIKVLQPPSFQVNSTLLLESSSNFQDTTFATS